jgi:hypothetical protein
MPFHLCLGRAPGPGEAEVLKDRFTRQCDRNRRDPDAARTLAADPLGPLPAGMEPAELAARTAPANVLLNLDGVPTIG